MPHRHPVKVRFYELDPYGHLNHSVYVQLFETGRIELLEEAGIPLQVLEEQGYRFLVSRTETSLATMNPAITPPASSLGTCRHRLPMTRASSPS